MPDLLRPLRAFLLLLRRLWFSVAEPAALCTSQQAGSEGPSPRQSGRLPGSQPLAIGQGGPKMSIECKKEKSKPSSKQNFPPRVPRSSLPSRRGHFALLEDLDPDDCYLLPGCVSSNSLAPKHRFSLGAPAPREQTFIHLSNGSRFEKRPKAEFKLNQKRSCELQT
jgi:hypothetical protein